VPAAGRLHALQDENQVVPAAGRLRFHPAAWGAGQRPALPDPRVLQRR